MMKHSLLILSLCTVVVASSCTPASTLSKHTEQDGHDDHDEDDEGDEGEHGQEVHLSPEALKRMGVVVSKVEAAPPVGGVKVPAEIQVEPDREAHVSSVVAGQLSRVSASIGDHVKAGQTLAVLRSVALGQARAQAARSAANVAVAKANFDRQQELQKEKIGARRQFLEAQAALRRAEAERSAANRALEVYGRGGSGSEMSIKSPISGRIVARHATVGEVVSPTDALFKVTDNARVWVIGQVYQQNAGQVAEGASAVLTLQAFPGRVFRGELDYVAPALDERTRTLPVRLVLDNPDGVLKPGLFGTLSIRPPGSAQGTVPTVAPGAVQRMGDSTVVFVPGDGEGEFRAVSVATGATSRAGVSIRTGLKVGDRYVSQGAFVLKSEMSRGQLGEGHAH